MNRAGSAFFGFPDQVLGFSRDSIGVYMYFTPFLDLYLEDVLCCYDIFVLRDFIVKFVFNSMALFECFSR